MNNLLEGIFVAAFVGMCLGAHGAICYRLGKSKYRIEQERICGECIVRHFDEKKQFLNEDQL